MDYIQKFWNIISDKKNNVWIENYIWNDYNNINSSIIETKINYNIFGNYNKCVTCDFIDEPQGEAYPSYINNIKNYNKSNYNYTKSNDDDIIETFITYKINSFTNYNKFYYKNNNK